VEKTTSFPAFSTDMRDIARTLYHAAGRKASKMTRKNEADFWAFVVLHKIVERWNVSA
jgi:hypothetical protein